MTIQLAMSTAVTVAAVLKCPEVEVRDSHLMFHIKTCDKSLVKSCVGLKIDQFSQYHAVGAVMKLTFCENYYRAKSL